MSVDTRHGRFDNHLASNRRMVPLGTLVGSPSKSALNFSRSIAVAAMDCVEKAYLAWPHP